MCIMSKRKTQSVKDPVENQPIPPQVEIARNLARTRLASLRFDEQQISKCEETGEMPVRSIVRRLFAKCERNRGPLTWREDMEVRDSIAMRRFKGIHAVLIDGVGDLVVDPHRPDRPRVGLISARAT